MSSGASCKTLCKGCCGRIWPVLIAVFLSGLVAFLTWLALDSADVAFQYKAWLCSSAFVLAAGLILWYMAGCIRRHCPRARQSLAG